MQTVQSANSKLEATRKLASGCDFDDCHKNVDMKCSFNNHPICCEAIKGAKHVHHLSHSHSPQCVINKKYISSPYELQHIEKAKSLNLIKNATERKSEFISFITSAEEIEHAKKWLHRVAMHMKSSATPNTTYDDEFYLSKFIITQDCPGEKGKPTIEWIEPLSVHARHPFGLVGCDEFSSARFYTDFIITKSGLDVTSYGKKSRNFFFDAGSSFFDSSLALFYCFYAQ
eukprot:gene13933-18688_t